MKTLLVILTLLLVPTSALAQCNGVFGSNQVCGSVSGGPPGPAPFSSFSGGGGGGLIVGTTTVTGGSVGDCLTIGSGVLNSAACSGGGSGNVVGPNTSVVGHIATWNNTTGTLLADGGLASVYHSKDAGAKGDVDVRSCNVSIASGTNTLTINSGTGCTSFSSANNGMLLALNGAGSSGGTLFTTITTATSGTTLTLGNNAGTTLTSSAQIMGWGTNDTSALQAWLNTCMANISLQCILDASYYATNADLNITSVINVIGYLPASDVVVPFTATQNCYNINLPINVINGSIKGIGCRSFFVQTSGAGLLVQGSGGGSWNYNSLYFSGMVDGITVLSPITNASAVAVIQNVAIDCLRYCIQLDGTGANGGFEDGFISNSFLEPVGTGAIGLVLINSSGVKVTNTKINSGASNSGGVVWVGTASCVSCSDLFFSNMSVEVVGPAFKMQRGSATGHFSNIAISGGEWAGSVAFDISDTSLTGFFTNISITGGTDAAENGSFAANFGAVNGFVFSGNAVQGFGSTTTGVIVGASSTAGVITDNSFTGTITTSVTNSSTTTLAKLTGNGHTAYVGVSPTVGTCGGAGAAVSAGSTDNIGQVGTGSTASSSCVVNLARAYASPPLCTGTNTGGGANLFAITTTTTAITLNYNSSSSQFYNWSCYGQ